MLAPNSIMSLNQGADLARWNMQRLYGTPAAEAEQEMEEDTPTEAVPAVSRVSVVLAGLARFATRLLQRLLRQGRSMPGLSAR